MTRNSPIIMEETISQKIADAINEVYDNTLCAQSNMGARIYMRVTPADKRVDVEGVVSEGEDEKVQQQKSIIITEEEMTAYQANKDYIMWFSSQLVEKDSFLGWTEKRGKNVIWVLGKITLGEPK